MTSSHGQSVSASGIRARRNVLDWFRAIQRSAALSLLLVVTGVGAAPLMATPFVPNDGDQILERLPNSIRANSAELAQLEKRLRQTPDNLSLATELARRYIELGRLHADPRYAGYAQAALQPWWNQADAPTEVLVMRAILRERRHEFDAALADLSRVLDRDPRHGQARLSRASLHEVVGNYRAAAEDCRLLTGISSLLVASTCRASVAARNGRAPESFSVLREIVARQEDHPNIAWATTVLAEIAMQLGREDTEHLITRALAFNENDPYVLGLYADFLLHQGRAGEVVRLLASHSQVDALLLRLALAEALALEEALASEEDKGAAKSADALRVERHHAHLKELATRFEAGRRRGDTIHLREEATYQLELRKDPSTALRLAKQNWEKQREPADAEIVLKAALALGRSGQQSRSTAPGREVDDARSSAHSVLEWLREKQLTHAHLQPLVDAAHQLGWAEP